MCVSLKFLLLFSFTLGMFLAGELPPFIHVCRRNDPNLEQCLVAAVEEVRPYLVKGVPEYDIPSLEPLVMKDLISEDTGGLKIVTSNVNAYGCSDFLVRNLTIDKVSHVYNILIDIPKLRVEADYQIDGKLLVLPIKGNGNMEANATDCISICTLQGEIYEKDGEQYLRFISIDLKIEVGEGHVRLENLFNGDKILLGVINDVVNKNLQLFLKELLPMIEKALANVFLDISNNIVDSYTLDQLLPQ